AFLHGGFRVFLVGNVQMGTDKLQGPFLAVAFNLRDCAYPSCLTIARPNYAILSFIVSLRALEGGQKVLFNALSVVWVNAGDPFLVRFVDSARGKPMKVKVFRRAVTPEAV